MQSPFADDEATMNQKRDVPPVQTWDLMLIAVSEAAPSQLLEHLSHSISACGGWVLRHGAVSPRCADIDFEFPRLHAMEIYCLLVGSGVELSTQAHQQLSELCHCTWQVGHAKQASAARVNLTLYAREDGEAFLGEQPGALQAA